MSSSSFSCLSLSVITAAVIVFLGCFVHQRSEGGEKREWRREENIAKKCMSQWSVPTGKSRKFSHNSKYIIEGRTRREGMRPETSVTYTYPDYGDLAGTPLLSFLHCSASYHCLALEAENKRGRQKVKKEEEGKRTNRSYFMYVHNGTVGTTAANRITEIHALCNKSR